MKISCYLNTTSDALSHNLGLGVDIGHGSLVEHVDQTSLGGSGAAVGLVLVGDHKVHDNNNDNDEDDGNWSSIVSKTAIFRATGTRVAINLPQIPQQIHFFLRVLLAVSTAVSSSTFACLRSS